MNVLKRRGVDASVVPEIDLATRANFVIGVARQSDLIDNDRRQSTQTPFER
jgi:hypothetical protein